MNKNRFLSSRHLLVLLILCSQWFATAATNITITQVEWQYQRETTRDCWVHLNLSWQNAWNRAQNHDGAWLFIKLRMPNGRYRHLKMLPEGHQQSANLKAGASDAAFQVSADRAGLFVYPSKKTYLGDIAWKLRIALDPENFENIDRLSECRLAVFALEMVLIPEGGFTLGDPDTTALQYGAFYRSGSGGTFNGLFQIKNETERIAVGPENGQLYYRSKTKAYQGDTKGPVPWTFPKGVQAFWCMKYELTQGQYATFLNTLSDMQTHPRANIGGRNAATHRHSIYLKNQQYKASYPDAPCNFLSWDDACAYADWAGLRPMTELEFTKASRGPGKPIAQEFPWGTGNKDALLRYPDATGTYAMPPGYDEKGLNESSRATYGASYYWVMDLAGGVWERCITIGDSTGRAFSGSHGNGHISYMGFATNADWPKGSTETAGFGFRGGGFYSFNRQYGEFNPHSPIAYRRFGSWPGGYRAEAYGSRFVRTVTMIDY